MDALCRRTSNVFATMYPGEAIAVHDNAKRKSTSNLTKLLVDIIFMDMANKKQNEIAINLTMAVKHLSVRLRAELQANPEKLNMTQISILFHLHTNGSTTTTTLASSEHITQQAISQIVASMKDAGWIKATPDPNDGRKTLLSITRSGEELRESLIDYCDEWVAKTMQAILNEKERAILIEATGLLERLANAKSSTRNV